MFTKKSFFSQLLVLFIIFTPSVFASAQTPDIAGAWQGALEVAGGIKLRVIFHIEQKQDGTLTATLDSPDQGATGIPTGTTSFTDNRLEITVPMVGGKLEGMLREDGSIEGTWSQGGGTLPLTLSPSDKVDGPSRPQTPKAPYPYMEEQVSYENADAGITLAGTLTMPRSGGPFPAVILITGSGPQDRDETILSHKPFLVLADHLTRKGFAVLRHDDRGVGQSTGSFATATSEDFAGDTMAGIAYLKTRSEINSNKIGLAGHSEGGMIAPMVAVRSPDVAFVVMLAGPGIPGDELLTLQSGLISKAMGASEALIRQSRIDSEAMYEILESEKDNTIAEQKLRAYRKQALAGYTDAMKEEMKKFGDPEKLFDAGVKQLLTPWFRYFLTYDPVPTLQKVTCPVLAIVGENDLQVPATQNNAAIEKALKAGGNENYTVTILPGLNHLFQTSSTGAPAEYGVIEETFSPAALEIISDWLVKHTETM